MTDRRWSELPDTTPTDTDATALQRGTSNFRWTFQALRTWLAGFFESAGSVANHDGSPTAHGSVEANYAAHAAAANPHSGSAATSTSIDGINSVSGGGSLAANRTMSLVNDLASPGANQVYGTNAGGTKGWKPDPAGGSSPLTTKGDLYTRDNSADARLPVGANGTFLSADSTEATGLKWETVSVAYQEIQDEAVALTARPVFNFTGAGVTATDNPGQNRTDIAIPGSPGGGEANDGANVGVVGEGVYRDKTAETLNFKKLVSSSGTIAISAVGGDNVGIDAGSEVVLTTAGNVFVLDQVIRNPGSGSGLQVDATNPAGVGYVSIKSGTGSADARMFSFHSDAGVLTTHARNDEGGDLRSIQQISHAGGTAFGAPAGGIPSTLGHVNAVELLRDNAAVLTGDKSDKLLTGYDRTPTDIASGGNYTPDYRTNQFVRLTGDASTTILTPANYGSQLVTIPADVASITLTGWTVRGTDPGGNRGLMLWSSPVDDVAAVLHTAVWQ